jgi:acyl-CoA thioester hydrolase
MDRVTSTQTRPSPLPVVLEVTPRYSDLDPSRRVGREALVRWFEDVRTTALHRAFPHPAAGAGTLVVSVQLDVLAPLQLGDGYRVGFGITSIGRSSFTGVHNVYVGDELVATGSAACVYAVDGAAAPLPADARTVLEELSADLPAPSRRSYPESRLVRENYPFRYDVRTRFGDLDTNRHVNNVALSGWYLDGLAELHTDVLGYPAGGPLDGLAPSSLHVEYLDEVRFPGIYQLRVGIRELEDGTVSYECALFDGPKCLGLADAAGSVRTDEVDLTSAFEAFRMKN